MKTKKLFIQPSLKVVMLDVNDLIATSNVSPKNVNLNLDLDEIEEEGYAD